MKKVFGFVLLVIVLLIIVVLVKDPASVGTIKIGVAVGQTGYADEWGQGELRAVQMAVDLVNETGGIKGKQVEIIAENTKSDAVGTVSAITKLVTVDKVKAIIGPTWGDSFQGGFPIIEKNKVLTITPSGALETVENKKDFTYLFSTWWPQQAESKALVDSMLEKKLSKLVIVHDKDAFNTKMSDILMEQAKASGISIIDRVDFPVGTTDFRTYIAKIKQQNPDAIFVLMQDTSQTGPFNKQLKEQKVTAKIYSTASTENQSNLDKFPGQFEGVMYTAPKIVSSDNYLLILEEYKNKYGSQPSGPSFLNAFNAARFVLKVLEDEEGDILKTAKQTKINGIGMHDISFDENGQIGGVEFRIKQIKDDKFIY